MDKAQKEFDIAERNLELEQDRLDEQTANIENMNLDIKKQIAEQGIDEKNLGEVLEDDLQKVHEAKMAQF